MTGSGMPRLMVDVFIPSGRGVVLIRRASDPFEGRWPLPGGFVEIGETVESSAAHEAAEKTGLAVELARLVGVYPDPERDPRTRPPNATPAATTAASPFSPASSGGTSWRPPTPLRSPSSTPIPSNWPSRPSKHHRRRDGRIGGRYSLASQRAAFYCLETTAELRAGRPRTVLGRAVVPVPGVLRAPTGGEWGQCRGRRGGRRACRGWRRRSRRRSCPPPSRP